MCVSFPVSMFKMVPANIRTSSCKYFSRESTDAAERFNSGCMSVGQAITLDYLICSRTLFIYVWKEAMQSKSTFFSIKTSIEIDSPVFFW